MSKEELLKEIDYVKGQIEVTQKHNSNSGDLSFLYWQLHELEKDLKELEEKE